MAVSGLVVGLSAVILAVTADQPRIMTIEVSAQSRGAETEQALQDLYRVESEVQVESLHALPFGPLDAYSDRTLDLALRRWVKAQTDLDLGYVEQLYSFGDRFRDPLEEKSGQRVISIAYLALVREEKPSAVPGSSWRNVYDFLPWEDFRGGEWSELRSRVVPALTDWIQRAEDSRSQENRRLRAHMVFGLDGAPWDADRVLERYELLYEVGLVQEARQGKGLGRPMGLDHRRIAATALGRLRGKIRYRPVVFELLPDEFTLWQLQRTVEALSGLELHKQNFRRLVEQGRLVEGTSRLTQARGRPAELFRFRREVVRERPAPGVGLPRS
jgi:hypothetical protein